MNIWVALKQILDPEIPTRDFAVDGTRRVAARGSASLVLNIFCANALETALQFRERHGGTITALSFGPPSAEDVLRKALALTADEAVLIDGDKEANPDPLAVARRDWRLLKKIVNHVGKAWKKKDAGMWETRGRYRHYVYSKVMCWVAVDRGIKIAEKKGFAAPLPHWHKLREDIQKAIFEKGYNKQLNSFVQSFGSTSLDAANLLIPLVGFLPISDSRVQGTIAATKKYLKKKGGLVMRYNSDDGLPGNEGSFILCTYWLIDVLALSGHIAEAEKLYNKILQLASPVGLLSEEINLKTKQQQGNIPQAFSHIGLINSALYIGLAKRHFI